MQSFKDFWLYPNYHGGLTFLWELANGYPITPDLRFQVQVAGTVFGDDAQDLSPLLGPAHRAWAEECRRVVGPRLGPYYRVQIVGTAHATEWIAPTAQLSKREFLLLREMMRKEYVMMKHSSGVPVLVYQKALWGAACTVCTDPITGDVRNGDCPTCLGTGYDPPFYAPVETWAEFSPLKRDPGLKRDDRSNEDQQVFGAQLIPNPRLDEGDIVFDLGTGKGYFIDKTEHVAEIRRLPVLMQAELREIPTGRAVYRMFDNAPATII